MDDVQQKLVLEGLKYFATAIAGGGGIVWFNAWQGRRDKQRQNERENASDVVTRDRELWERLEGDNEELRDRLRAAGAKIESLRRELLWWEDLARWWSRKAHDLSHALLSARWGASHVLEEAGKPVPESWRKAEELPALQAPVLRPPE